MVVVAASDEDGVVADGVGVQVHDLAVDDQTGRDVLPGGGVQANPRDGPEVRGQCRDQCGQLDRDVPGARPPGAVQEPLAGLCGFQPEQGGARLDRLVDRVREEFQRGGVVGCGHGDSACLAVRRHPVQRPTAASKRLLSWGTSPSFHGTPPTLTVRRGEPTAPLSPSAPENTWSEAASWIANRSTVKRPGVFRTPAPTRTSFPAITAPGRSRTVRGRVRDMTTTLDPAQPAVVLRPARLSRTPKSALAGRLDGAWWPYS